MALTIRLTELNEKLIERLKDYFGTEAASKALLKAARLVIDELIPIKDKLRQANEDLSDLHAKHNTLKKLIDDRTAIDQQIAIISGHGQAGSGADQPGNCNHFSPPAAARGDESDCSFSSYEIVCLEDLETNNKVLLLDISGKPGVFTVDEINIELESFTVKEHSFDITELYDIIVLTK